jgi:hypothetical protein
MPLEVSLQLANGQLDILVVEPELRISLRQQIPYGSGDVRDGAALLQFVSRMLGNQVAVALGLPELLIGKLQAQHKAAGDAA